jgi:hypothetical protein
MPSIHFYCVYNRAHVAILLVFMTATECELTAGHVTDLEDRNIGSSETRQQGAKLQQTVILTSTAVRISAFIICIDID